jgi:high-affinity iron transporter
MLATAIIVFREALEAALVITIVLAATRGVLKRGLWVSGGVALGALGALVLAFFADQVAAAASGFGQELVNATVLLIAVAMLGWHNVWMNQHGRELALDLKHVGNAVRDGTRPLYALAAVVGLAVLREGSEVVLFLYGVAASAPGQGSAMAGGGVLGFAAAAALGALGYFGLVHIPAKHLFTVTAWLVLFLAAGMASQAAQFLVQADMLPAWGEAVWDTSRLLSDESIAGRVMHTLIGYTARPDGIQIAAYLATLAIIVALTRFVARAHSTARAPQANPASPAVSRS